MAARGIVRNFKPLEILTKEQVERIHRGALDVLEVTGVRVDSERARKIYEKGGCIVDHEEHRVRFPPGLVVGSMRQFMEKGLRFVGGQDDLSGLKCAVVSACK